jgi:hypothetical protein
VLGALVGDLLREQGGDALFERVETVRVASIRTREGDASAERRLSELLAGLTAAEAGELTRAFSTYFQVVNLAEKIHRIRRRRDYLREPGAVQRASLLDAFLELERRRGALPPGPLGEVTLRALGPKVEGLLEASTLERELAPESHDVDVALGDGTRLAGTVAGVRGTTVLSLTYSRLAPRHRLLAWVDLLALTVSQPAVDWRAVAVGRGRGRVRAQRSVFDPLPLADAEAALVGTLEHSVLGTRWVYDGLRDPCYVRMLAAVSLTGHGQSVGMVELEGRWHAARSPITIHGGGWNEGGALVDGFDLATDDAAASLLRNDAFEMVVHRRPVAGPQPAVGLSATWEGQDDGVVLAEIRAL